MRVRHKDNHLITGYVSTLNTSSFSEFIVYYDEGDASSEFMRDYEVRLERTGEWKPVMEALHEGLLAVNDANTHIFEVT